MIRTLIYLLVTVLIITFLRGVIGLIGKAVAQLFEPARPDSQTAPTGGELKQDPVCGIYVSTATKVRKTVNGKEYYFCSEACREKFNG